MVSRAGPIGRDSRVDVTSSAGVDRVTYGCKRDAEVVEAVGVQLEQVERWIDIEAAEVPGT